MVSRFILPIYENVFQRKPASTRCTHQRTTAIVLWRKFSVTALLLTALCFGIQNASAQSTPNLRADHPDRYVVKEGDTLWNIAQRFLKDPWRWPLIWQHNPDVENPHRIYPGDLLVVTGANNIKVVRLKPKVRRSALDRGIPAIPPNVIQPFLTAPIIIQPGELDESGYVLQGVDDELILGKYNQFYARGITDTEALQYRVFKVGKSISHPETDELLGIETKHLGDVRMLRADEDISKMMVVDSDLEIGPGDRILPVNESEPLPYYEPRSPDTDIEGWVLYAPKGVRDAGRFDIVIISGGEREGLEPGHVLRSMIHRGPRIDPVTGGSYQPPDEASGLMMVFRVYEKLSYALIMETTRAVSIGDRYVTP